MGRARVLVKVMLCVLMSFTFCFATACKDTDALKEIVYDQQSSLVDYDNPNKFYLNDPTSDVPSELVSAIDRADSSRVTDEVQNVVVYSSHPNTEGNKTKNSVFDYYPSYSGIEASLGVRFETNPQETKTPPEPQPPEDTPDEPEDPSEAPEGTPDEPDDPQETTASKNAKNPSKQSDKSDPSKEGNESDPDSENPDPEAPEEEGGDPSPEETPEGSGAASDQVQIASDTTSAFTEPPEVESIAAYGEYAVIVQMVGGSGALAATDRETLNSAFSTVFAGHGAASIAEGWADDGKTAAAMDVDAIIASGAQTVLVPTSEYGAAGNGLTEDDVRKLNEANVTLTVVYPLTNSTYIKDTVSTVATMLEKSTKKEFDDTVARANAYRQFHDGLVGACVSVNGGLAGSMVYEMDNYDFYGSNPAAPYTLLIDEYDTSARFIKAIGDVGLTTNGVGVATFNYRETPVSYYIQAGGLINTGAAKSTDSQMGKIAVWQFNTNIRSFKKEYWSYDEDGALARSQDVSDTSSAGWDYVLTSCSSERNGLSISGDVSVVGLSASFGSKQFPRIIAGTQQVKSMMIENSKSATGLYHAYDVPAGDYNPATYGLPYSSTGILYSSIGIDGVNGIVDSFSTGVIPDDSICVTPHGLFDSWLEGTLESCLEAAWVTDVVNGAGTVGYADYIRDFYRQFYDYELSAAELDRIVAGAAE